MAEKARNALVESQKKRRFNRALSNILSGRAGELGQGDLRTLSLQRSRFFKEFEGRGREREALEAKIAEDRRLKQVAYRKEYVRKPDKGLGRRTEKRRP